MKYELFYGSASGHQAPSKWIIRCDKMRSPDTVIVLQTRQDGLRIPRKKSIDRCIVITIYLSQPLHSFPWVEPNCFSLMKQNICSPRVDFFVAVDPAKIKERMLPEQHSRLIGIHVGVGIDIQENLLRSHL